MLRLALFLVAVYAYVHNGNADTHNHGELVHLYLNASANSLRILFEAPSNENFDKVRFTAGSLQQTDLSGDPHGDHTDWIVWIHSNSFQYCDDVSIVVEGYFSSTGTIRTEFNGQKEIPGDDC